MFFVVLIFVVSVVVVALIMHRKKKRVKLTYNCSDGDFRIQGEKDNFKIRKGNRFVFHVVDGQIVSFVDKSAHGKAIQYEESEHGDF
jgi:hypothetical protein